MSSRDPRNGLTYFAAIGSDIAWSYSSRLSRMRLPPSVGWDPRPAGDSSELSGFILFSTNTFGSSSRYPLMLSTVRAAGSPSMSVYSNRIGAGSDVLSMPTMTTCTCALSVDWASQANVRCANRMRHPSSNRVGTGWARAGPG